MIAALLILLAQVTMNTGAPGQTVQGWGTAGSVFGQNGAANEGALYDSHIDLLFDCAKGLCLNILREGIASVDAGTGSKFEDNNPGFNNAVLDARTITQRYPSVKVILLPWSPNVACKSGGSLLSGSFVTSCNASWAAYVSSAVDDMQNAGVPVYAVTPQNEPDFDSGGSHETCTFSGASMTSFTNTLAPLIAAKTPRPLLMLGDTSQWSNMWGGLDYVDTCLADTTCKAAVSIWAAHEYDPGISTSPGAVNGFPVWMTEYANLGSYDPSMSWGLTFAAKLDTALVLGNVSAYVWWWGAANQNSGEGLLASNDGITYTATKGYYVFGQWTKFVRPGMVRFGITGTPPTNVKVETYKDPISSNIAVVAINTNASGTSLTVTLDATSKVRMVTPWVTDASNNITRLTPIRVDSRSFTITLLPNSVTTLSGIGT